MRVSFLFLPATVVLLPLVFAANSTAAVGTNCDIISIVTVKPGDSLVNIATASNITLDQVLFANPNITNPRLINPGGIIKIPNSACVTPASKHLAEPTTTCSNGTASMTTVFVEDTLINIAKEIGRS
jgi:LysM repeat protein